MITNDRHNRSQLCGAQQPSWYIDPHQNRFLTSCFKPAAIEAERTNKKSHQSRNRLKSGFLKKKHQYQLHNKTSHQSREERKLRALKLVRKRALLFVLPG